MTSFEPVQAGPYLTPSDPPDLANITKAIVDWAATRSNMRFASTAARDAAIPAPLAGMECVTGTGAALVKWLYFNAAWLDITVGPWKTYTPAWTAATTNPVLGNGTLTGQYLQVGKTVHYRIVLTMGSTTTYGSGYYQLSLPVASSVATHIAGYGVGFNLTNRKSLMAYYASSSIIRPLRCSTDVEVDQTGLGVAWAAGHVLTLTGTYQAA